MEANLCLIEAIASAVVAILTGPVALVTWLTWRHYRNGVRK